MKLICAIDFSEPSLEAARVAVRLARRFGDELLLVHAWTSPLLYYRELIADPLRVEEKAVAKVTVDLESLAQTFRAQGLTVTPRLVHDADPAEALTALGREVDARLIVVGAHSRRAAARLFLGSVAERAMLLADRPVLIVHPGGTAIDDWIEGKRPLRIAMGLDRSAASVAALEWVRTLRELGPCDVTFVHAFWPLAEYARLGVRGTIDLAASDQETLRALTRELRPLFADLPGSGTVDLRLRPVWGSAAEPILDEAKAAGADLLILGTNQKRALARFWAGATVQPAVRLAQLPVLCVPARAAHQPAAPPRPQLRNILAATDFSELGDRAVAYAFELARNGGTVTLCHVRERALSPAAYNYVDDRGALTEGQRHEIEDRLRALIPPNVTGVATTLSVIDGGHADMAIVQESNRIGADAICVGSHGRTGVVRALMGSVAESVVRRAERPVLIIRPGP
ncbi:MAG TPA: universal stress protein [Polyangia bacterium]|nr:universal stress protein [Polyangia bacterium]